MAVSRKLRITAHYSTFSYQQTPFRTSLMPSRPTKKLRISMATDYPTRTLSEVLSNARDNDLSTWLCNVTVADLSHDPPGGSSQLLGPRSITRVSNLVADDYIVVKWNTARDDASFMFCLITAIHPVRCRGKLQSDQVKLDLEHTESYLVDGEPTNTTCGFHVSNSGYGKNWCAYEVYSRK